MKKQYDYIRVKDKIEVYRATFNVESASFGHVVLVEKDKPLNKLVLTRKEFDLLVVGFKNEDSMYFKLQ